MSARSTTAFLMVVTISVTSSVRTLGAGPKPDGKVPSWAKVSAEQKAAATKLGVPVAFENEIGMRFVLIPPGTFMMGSRDPAAEVARRCAMPNAQAGWFWDEHPRHKVTVAEAFYMSIHEVTLGNIEKLAGAKPPKKAKKGKKDKEKTDPPPEPKDPNLPAVNVSCNAAEKFCKDLSGRDKRRYALPTESQWEYACRAGTETPFSFGETITTDQANYHGGYIYGKDGRKGKFREKALPVGSLAANAWGLYDMHGNVLEWCANRYFRYDTPPETDPKKKPQGNERVLRGGSWRSYPGACRSAFRLKREGGAGSEAVGFRVCCALPTAQAEAPKKK